jgi:hypothetical protein
VVRVPMPVTVAGVSMERADAMLQEQICRDLCALLPEFERHGGVGVRVQRVEAGGERTELRKEVGIYVGRSSAHRPTPMHARHTSPLPTGGLPHSRQRLSVGDSAW